MALIYLFNYYHWSAGNAFLDRFDPDIDSLKIANVISACFGLSLAWQLRRTGNRLAVWLGFLCAAPGCASILIYG